MGMGILGWQLLILVTIVASGRSRGIAVVFWVIWTAVQVFALPLSLLQFGTIWLGHTIAAALFPNRPSDTSEPSSAAPKAAVPPGTKSSKPAAPKDLSELLRSIAKDPHSSPMPSISTRAQVDWLARRQQEKELEEVRRQVREMYRKTPSAGEPVVKTTIPTAPVSIPSPARAPVATRPTPASNTPPPDPGISESLLKHLEMLNRSSVDRTPIDLPSSEKSSANTRKGLCVKCDPKRSKAVGGMRYCGDCGAFVGMAH